MQMDNKSLVLAHIATIHKTVEEEQRATRARTQAHEKAVSVLRLAVRALRELTTDSAHVEELVRKGVIPHLVEFLERDASPLLQVDALLLLGNIARKTNNKNVYHLREAGVLTHLIHNLESTNNNVRAAAVTLLGTIAADSAAARNQCLDHGALDRLLKHLSREQDPERKRMGVRALKTLCTMNPLPKWDQVTPALPMLAELLQDHDPEVIRLTCLVLISMCGGDDNQLQQVLDTKPSMVQRLVELLTSEVTGPVGWYALQVLSQMASGNDQQLQTVLDMGALSAIPDLLSMTRTRADALFLLSNVTAGTTAQIQMVFDAGLFQLVMNAPFMRTALGSATSEPKSVNQALWFVTNAILGLGKSPLHRKLLIDQGCIRFLWNSLTNGRIKKPTRNILHSLDKIRSGRYSGMIPVRLGFAMADTAVVTEFTPFEDVTQELVNRVIQTFFVTKAAALEVCAAWDRAAAESVLHDIVVSGLADKRYMGSYSSVPERLKDPTMRGEAPQYRSKGTTIWLLLDLNGHWVVTDDQPSVGSIDYRSRIRSSQAVQPGTLPGNAGPWHLYWPKRKQWTTYKQLTVTKSENMIPPQVD